MDSSSTFLSFVRSFAEPTIHPTYHEGVDEAAVLAHRFQIVGAQADVDALSGVLVVAQRAGTLPPPSGGTGTVAIVRRLLLPLRELVVGGVHLAEPPYLVAAPRHDRHDARVGRELAQELLRLEAVRRHAARGLEGHGLQLAEAVVGLDSLFE